MNEISSGFSWTQFLIIAVTCIFAYGVRIFLKKTFPKLNSGVALIIPFAVLIVVLLILLFALPNN